MSWLQILFESDKEKAEALGDLLTEAGALAIAAAKLGAKHVWAVDLDTQALYATHENACKNKVETHISLVEPADLLIIKADCLLANILARPLIELATYFADQARAGTPVILSGILDTQADAVTASYQPWFDITSTLQQGDWVRLVMKRKPNQEKGRAP